MKKILEEVMTRRMINAQVEERIQLSYFFFQKLLIELYKYAHSTGKPTQYPDFAEIKYMFYNVEWTIYHRAYRDDSNDSDVDEALWEFAVKDVS